MRMSGAAHASPCHFLCTLQDEQYDNLAHIISCDQQTCFVFDFQFTSTDGFSSAADSPPTIQLVFQYSLLVPQEAAAAAAEQLPGQAGPSG